MHADGVTVVHNGEIYNCGALRLQLEQRGAQFSSTTDTEVILRGWQIWGEKIVERLEGMFSFAVVDDHKGLTFMARDRLGVKPLYWGRVGRAIVAGSAPRALIAVRPALGTRRDEVAISEFLTLLWIPHPRTPWADIKKLPPGTALTVDQDGARQWRYWQPPRRTKNLIDPSDLRERVAEAVHAQLLSDVPVGLLLSGGLDSTFILADMAAAANGDPFDTFTAGYDSVAQRFEINPDDAAYAKRASECFPTARPHAVMAGDAPLQVLDTLAPHFDDPVADPAALTLYQLARGASPKVLLSGVGGEELFAGYPRHTGLGLARGITRLPGGVRRALGVVAPHLRGASPGPLYGMRRNAQKFGRAVAGRRHPFYWRMLAQLTFGELDAMRPGFALHAFEELDGLTLPLKDATLDDALAFDLGYFLPNHNLAYADKASMAASVELRVPLLDESVVSLTTAADANCLIAGGHGKAPLRAAAAGVVPDEIIRRPKSGFGGPVRAWFQGPEAPELWERVVTAADAGLVEVGGARKLFEAARTGQHDAALAGWSLVCLQAWHQHHG